MIKRENYAGLFFHRCALVKVINETFLMNIKRNGEKKIIGISKSKNRQNKRDNFREN